MKKAYSMKALSIFLSLLLILSTFVGVNLINVNAEQQIPAGVLVDNDFENAAYVSAYVNSNDGTDYENEFGYTSAYEWIYTPNGKKYSGAIIPVLDPDPYNATNKVLRYRHYGPYMGIIRLADDYADAVTDTKLTAEAGKTYQVKFEWKTEGNAVDANPITFGVGLATYDFADDITMDDIDAASKVEVKSLGIGEMGSADWVNETVTFTAPATLPEGKDQLVIWVTGGRKGENNTVIYFDNVKVTSNNNAPSISIENNFDFENAPYVSAYVNSNDGNDFENEFGYTSAYEWIVTPNGQNYSGAIIPVLDPDPYNATNRVLRYRNYSADMGIIRLADNYADAAADTKLTVEAGKTYQVKFEWKTEGNAVENKPITFGVGLATYDFADMLTMDDIDAASKVEAKAIALGETGSADWVSETVTFTAPATLPEGKDQLVIWVTGGRGKMDNTCIYFDNVKVTSNNNAPSISIENNFNFENAPYVSAYVNSNDGNDFENEFGYTSAYEWIYTPNGKNYSGAIIPVLDPDPYNATNRVLRYRYYGLDMGIIRLADNYADAVTDTKLTAEAGKTYQVKFEWKTEGNAVDANPITFGVGLATYDFADDITMDDIDAASKVEVKSLGIGEMGSADWVNETVTFTAPATLPEGKDQLVIWVTGGRKGENNTVIYFDNVEVTSSSEDSGISIKNNLDFENAPYVSAYVNSNDGNDFENEFGYTSAYEWIVTPNGQNYSGAIIPVLDPDPYNATNRVLRYRYYGLDMGIIRLADNYADAVTDTKLTVDAGETYQVKFKWKTEGNAVADTPIIFGVGLATYDFADQLTMDDIDDASKSVLMTLNVDETGPADWQSVVVNFTAPATLPEGKDQLVIWVTGGKKAANNTVIYFDDFEVASGNGIEEIQYVIKLDTRGGEKLPNLVGSYGVAYTLPKEAKKEGYKFLGWYTSSSFTTPAEDGIFTKESMTFYAKFVRNQSMNSFEEQWAKYPVVASDWFDSNLWYNTSRTIDKANSNWTSADAKYQFNAEGVRTGTGSIYSPGVNEKDAVFTFLLDEPLTIGETYTLSFWIKLNDYTEPGDIKFWYNNGNWNSGLLASPSGWDATIDRSEVCLNTSALSNNVGEWVEYRCNFVPKGYFAGLSIPAFTSCYIDDVVITSSYADETYDITAAGTGKVFEDWFNGDFGGVEGTFKPVVVTPENTVIDYADLPTEGVISGVEVENPNADKEEEKNDGPTYVKKYKDVVVTIPGSNSFMDYLWIIIAGGAVVLAGVAILVVVLIKKRNRKNG